MKDVLGHAHRLTGPGKPIQCYAHTPYDDVSEHKGRVMNGFAFEREQAQQAVCPLKIEGPLKLFMASK